MTGPRLGALVTTLAPILLLLVPGCTQPAAHASEGQPPSPGGRDLDGEGGDAHVPWPEGSWAAYSVASPVSINGEVVAVQRAGRFEPDQRRWALEDATRDLPILGGLDAATMATTAFGGPWDVLQLPLADGEHWSTEAVLLDPVGAPVPVRLDLAASAARVATPLRVEDGFTIQGFAGDDLVLEAAFAPSLHLPTRWSLSWQGNATWEAELVRVGAAWDGPWWSAAATPLVQDYMLLAPNASLVGPPEARPPLAGAFTMADPAATLFGYLIVVAFAGAQHAEVVDPAGRRVEATGLGLPVGWSVQVVDEPGRPGDWRYAVAGAGAVAFGAVFLWEVDLAEHPGTPPGGQRPAERAGA